MHGTRNDYHLVEQDNYILVDGLHEAIIPEDMWQEAQVKLAAQAKKMSTSIEARENVYIFFPES